MRLGAFSAALSLTLLFTACGPGIRTGLGPAPAPALAFTEPGSGSSVSDLQVAFTGTCTKGLSINISYSDKTTCRSTSTLCGPTVALCPKGTFSFTATLPALVETHTVAISQTNSSGTATASTKVSFSRTAFNQAGGFNGPVTTTAAALDGSGNIYVGGTFTTFKGVAANGLALLSSTGSLVTSFASPATLPGAVQVIAPLNDGSGDIYVGGSTGLIRYTDHGIEDTLFSNTLVSTSVSAISCTGVAAPVYAGGSHLFRVITSAGSWIVDPSFDDANSGGTFTGSIAALYLSPDSTLYVGGSFQNYQSVSGDDYLVGVTTTGGTAGVVADTYTFNNTVTSLIGSGTNLYVGGTFTQYGPNPANGILCIQPTSGPPAAICPAFAATEAAAGTSVTSLAFDSAGGVLMGGLLDLTGTLPTGNEVLDILVNGTAKSAFTVGNFLAGVAQSLPNVTSPVVAAITPSVDGSGDLYVGGSFVGFSHVVSGKTVGVGINDLAQFGSTGLPTTFNNGTGFSDTVLAIASIGDGTGGIYAGGDFAYYNGSSTPGLAAVGMEGQVTTFPSLTSGTTVSAVANLGGSNFCYGVSNSGNIKATCDVGGTTWSYTPVGNRPINAIVQSIDGSNDVYIGGVFGLE